MASIFTRIINGEIPAYKVAEIDDCLAFLDIRPMQEGHTLCVPKREVDYYYDLTDAELTTLTLFSKQVAKALKEVTGCRRVASGVLGLEVPHAHLHLVPINAERDFRFGHSVEVAQERMQELQQLIAAAFTKNSADADF